MSSPSAKRERERERERERNTSAWPDRGDDPARADWSSTLPDTTARFGSYAMNSSSTFDESSVPPVEWHARARVPRAPVSDPKRRSCGRGRGRDAEPGVRRAGRSRGDNDHGWASTRGAVLLRARWHRSLQRGGCEAEVVEKASTGPQPRRKPSGGARGIRVPEGRSQTWRPRTGGARRIRHQRGGTRPATTPPGIDEHPATRDRLFRGRVFV